LVQREELENKLLQAKILVFMHTFKFKNVQELVDALKGSNYSLTLKEIEEAVLELERLGKIKLREPPAQGSFFDFILGSFYTALPFWLSLMAISISLLAFYVLPDIQPFLTIRLIAGSLTVLLMPGYGLVGLILPSKQMSLFERIGLSIMLSLAIVAILWITLDQLHLGAEINSVVLSTSIVGVLLITASTYQKFLVNKIGEDFKK
jgi:hypothetical protein